MGIGVFGLYWFYDGRENFLFFYLLLIIVLIGESQQTHQRRINVKTTLIVNVHHRCFNTGWKCKLSQHMFIGVISTLNEIVFSTLIHDYHNFTSIVSYQQNCFWCQLKFNIVLTLTIRRWFNSDATSAEFKTVFQHILTLKQRCMFSRI